MKFARRCAARHRSSAISPTRRRRSHIVRFPRLAWALLPLCLLSGCGFFYEHRIEYPDFSLYGDHDLPKLERTGETIQQVFGAYRELFPSIADRVHGVRILYAEDSLSRENIYTGDLRQEGFYLPILDLIQLSPRRPRGEEDDLTVILHEMAHHFLISAFPDTSSAYWLNEGLACCLEISFFDPDGSLRTPLFNQALHQHARRLLRRDGRKTFENRVSELIDASWFEFHNDDAENSNYAYSWSFYWHLLESFEGTLESRILQIVDMTPEELRSKIPGMIDRLRGRTDDQLAQLARDPALRGWTLERWAELPFADGRRFLEPLQAEIAPENSPSELSWSRATRLVNSRVRGLSRSQRRDLHRKIARELGSIDTPVSIRITIAEALGTDGSRSWSYIEPLIDGLENANGEFRASCARALARLSRQKPTIVNPSFWQTAPPEIRAQEIDEWRNWFSRRR